MRIILKCDRCAHINKMLDNLKWLNIKYRLLLHSLKTIFKMRGKNIYDHIESHLEMSMIFVTSTPAQESLL